ncbi:MAG: hypothetical protein ACK4Z8_01055 [Novosphingobium sp.]
METANDGIGKAITSVAGIAGLCLTFNTLFTTCSKDSIDRSTAFRTTVSNEESFWSELYNKYVTAVSDPKDDIDLRRRKLMAIAFLANHPIPDLSEYKSRSLAPNRITAATSQLANMRLALTEALRDPQNSNEKVANEIGFFIDQQSAVRTRLALQKESNGTATPPKVTERDQLLTDAAIKSQPQAVVPQGEATPAYGSVILGAGPSIGWDIDIFWCEGPTGETERYKTALEIGQSLSQAAVAGKFIMPGMKLGRVRLRSLPVTQQSSKQFYTSGNALISDGGKGEAAAADALKNFIVSTAKKSLDIKQSYGANTNWYLSAFICSKPGSTA